MNLNGRESVVHHITMAEASFNKMCLITLCAGSAIREVGHAGLQQRAAGGSQNLQVCQLECRTLSWATWCILSLLSGACASIGLMPQSGVSRGCAAIVGLQGGRPAGVLEGKRRKCGAHLPLLGGAAGGQRPVQAPAGATRWQVCDAALATGDAGESSLLRQEELNGAPHRTKHGASHGNMCCNDAVTPGR